MSQDSMDDFSFVTGTASRLCGVMLQRESLLSSSFASEQV